MKAMGNIDPRVLSIYNDVKDTTTKSGFTLDQLMNLKKTIDSMEKVNK